MVIALLESTYAKNWGTTSRSRQVAKVRGLSTTTSYEFLRKQSQKSSWRAQTTWNHRFAYIHAESKTNREIA